MGLSETIIAAIIGAGATMATAIFQLVRNRAPSDVRPKKKRMRSLLATIALMIGCIVGGYAWSSLRAVSATEQMQATLQTEFTRQFAALSANRAEGSTPTTGAATDGGALAASHSTSGSAESLIQLPPCKIAARSDEAGVASCTEYEAHAVTLCAALPAAAQNARMQIMTRAQKPDSTWESGEADATTIGELHVSSAQLDPPPGIPESTACAIVANWSVEETLLVRLLVNYTLAPAPTPPAPAATPITASLQ